MSDEVEVVEVEIVDPVKYELSKERGASITDAFNPSAIARNELMVDYAKIIKMDETEEQSKLAGDLLKKFVPVRTGMKRIHSAQKELFLRGGQFCDAYHRAEVAPILVAEAALKDIKTREERKEALRIKQLQNDRAELLAPYVEDAHERDLAKFEADEFDALLAMKKKEHEDKIAAEKKVEDDRIAKEKAEAEENERIRKENARLEAEAKEREAKAKAEQIEREKAEAERIAKEAAERAAIEAEREKERKEAQDKLDAAEAERKRVEAEAKAKAEAEAKERADAIAREKNTATRKRVNNAVLDAIVLTMSEKHSGNVVEAKAIAKDIVMEIAKGNIPNVSINY